MNSRTGLLLCLVVIGAVAVTGCSSSKKSAGYGRFDTPRAFSGAATRVGATAAVVAAAAATPATVDGRVTQSSEAGDQISVTVSGSRGAPAIAVSYDGNPLVSTEMAKLQSDVQEVIDEEAGTELYERVLGRNFRGVQFYKSLEANDIDTNPVGNIWVDVFTDYEGDGDTDYLSGGIWVFVPEDRDRLSTNTSSAPSWTVTIRSTIKPN